MTLFVQELRFPWEFLQYLPQMHFGRVECPGLLSYQQVSAVVAEPFTFVVASVTFIAFVAFASFVGIATFKTSFEDSSLAYLGIDYRFREFAFDWTFEVIAEPLQAFIVIVEIEPLIELKLAELVELKRFVQTELGWQQLELAKPHFVYKQLYLKELELGEDFHYDLCLINLKISLMARLSFILNLKLEILVVEPLLSINLELLLEQPRLFTLAWLRSILLALVLVSLQILFIASATLKL
jgi:hypothetical protein